MEKIVVLRFCFGATTPHFVALNDKCNTYAMESQTTVNNITCSKSYTIRRRTRIYQNKHFNSTNFLPNERSNMSGQLPISYVVKLHSINIPLQNTSSLI